MIQLFLISLDNRYHLILLCVCVCVCYASGVVVVYICFVSVVLKRPVMQLEEMSQKLKVWLTVCSSVQLSLAQFSSAYLSSVQLTSVQLSLPQFSSAYLSSAQFTSVQLTSVQLSLAQVSSVQFKMISMCFEKPIWTPAPIRKVHMHSSPYRKSPYALKPLSEKPICAPAPIGKAHMCSSPYLRSFPNVAFETDPMLVWLTMVLSHPFKIIKCFLFLCLSSKWLMVYSMQSEQNFLKINKCKQIMHT